VSEHDPSVLGAGAAAGAAAAWQAGLDRAVEEANRAIHEVVKRRGGQSTDQLAGFVAEHWHASTFNIDAYKKGVWDLLASVPESNGKASFDVLVRRGDEVLLAGQSKYYKTAVETAKQLWNPDYDNTNVKIVPADQLQGVIDESGRKALAEAGTRPHVTAAAEHSVQHASDRLRVDGAESRPLDRHAANDVTDRARAGGDAIPMADVLSAREIAGKAAMGGAVAGGIGFALGAAPKLIEAVRAWRNGAGVGDEEFLALLHDAGRDGARAGVWAGFQGAVSTALVHMASTGALGEVFRGLGPGPIGAISVCVVQAVRDGLACWRGEITTTQLAQRCVTTGVVSAGGVAGAAVGQALIPIPMLGALIGSTVGSLLARAGVALAGWAVDALMPHIDLAINAMGNVLFGWDVLQRARQQSAEVDNLLEAAAGAAAGARWAEFEAFRALRLAPVDVDAICAGTAAQRTRLEALESGLSESSRINPWGVPPVDAF
jgi:hypothetical protein